jgi:hypothetical protein
MLILTVASDTGCFDAAAGCTACYLEEERGSGSCVVAIGSILVSRFKHVRLALWDGTDGAFRH